MFEFDACSIISNLLLGPKKDITLGIDAIQFLYGELTKWEWLQKTMLAVLGVTAFEEEPYADKTFDGMLRNFCSKKIVVFYWERV